MVKDWDNLQQYESHNPNSTGEVYYDDDDSQSKHSRDRRGGNGGRGGGNWWKGKVAKTTKLLESEDD